MPPICPLAEAPCQTDPRGAYITTYSGARFYVDECNVEDIPIIDIAHSLSMQCRFNGHVERFYSVAEHSVLISLICDPDEAMWGLMHDVTEAFLCDIPRPLKPYLDGYQELETRLMRHIAEAYNLEGPECPAGVKYYDTHIVSDEARALYSCPPEWIVNYESVCSQSMIKAYDPERAKWLFLERFNQLSLGMEETEY